ncbi:MAG TPA: hypothetical protein VG649_08560 [Candidatus Angelobacter sp.]|jgi:hypothetical protein|nr:hypothetical protein [Candidatus Angelobacter sp.]
MKHPNNVSARLENPNYGKHTLTTLKKIAATCDVGLVVWFVPFRRLVDWATGTPHKDTGLSPAFHDIPAFDHDPGIRAIQAKEAEEDKLVAELGSWQDERLPKKQPEPASFLGPIPLASEMSGAEAQAG